MDTGHSKILAPDLTATDESAPSARLDSTLQGREARSVGAFSSLASLSLVFTPPVTLRQTTSARHRIARMFASGGESGTDRAVRLRNVFQEGSAKQVQNLTPEPVDTIP